MKSYLSQIANNISGFSDNQSLKPQIQSFNNGGIVSEINPFENEEIIENNKSLDIVLGFKNETKNILTEVNKQSQLSDTIFPDKTPTVNKDNKSKFSETPIPETSNLILNTTKRKEVEPPPQEETFNEKKLQKEISPKKHRDEVFPLTNEIKSIDTDRENFVQEIDPAIPESEKKVEITNLKRTKIINREIQSGIEPKPSGEKQIVQVEKDKEERIFITHKEPTEIETSRIKEQKIVKKALIEPVPKVNNQLIPNEPKLPLHLAKSKNSPRLIIGQLKVVVVQESKNESNKTPERQIIYKQPATKSKSSGSGTGLKVRFGLGQI